MSRLLQTVSPLAIAFGGGAVSGEGGGYALGSISEEQSIVLLREAFDRGIRIFDTAPIYGYGLSEQRIGKAFKDNREDVFLVSKCGVTWHPDQQVFRSNAAVTTQKMLEQSLRDLDTDYIDLYMVHWPDEKVDIRVPMEVLAEARDKGQIKHIGLCNTSVSDLEKAKTIDRIEVAQSEFHLLARTPGDDLFPYLREQNISFMSWGTLDKGILTKRVDKSREQNKNYDDSDIRRAAPPWWNEEDILRKLDVLERIWPILATEGHSGLELAIGHNLAYPECTVVLVGPRTPEQLDGIFQALKNLPPNDLIDKVLGSIGDFGA